MSNVVFTSWFHTLQDRLDTYIQRWQISLGRYALTSSKRTSYTQMPVGTNNKHTLTPSVAALDYDWSIASMCIWIYILSILQCVRDFFLLHMNVIAKCLHINKIHTLNPIGYSNSFQTHTFNMQMMMILFRPNSKFILNDLRICVLCVSPHFVWIEQQQQQQRHSSTNQWLNERQLDLTVLTVNLIKNVYSVLWKIKWLYDAICFVKIYAKSIASSWGRWRRC